MQVLVRDENTTIKADRVFMDSGKPARYGVVDGMRVQLTEATPPPPEIFQYQDSFFYGNGQAVDNPAHVQHLPEPFRTQALAFIERSTGDPSEAAPGLLTAADRPYLRPAAKPSVSGEAILGQVEQDLTRPESPAAGADVPARPKRGRE